MTFYSYKSDFSSSSRAICTFPGPSYESIYAVGIAIYVLLAVSRVPGPPGAAYSAYIQFHFLFPKKRFFLFLFQAICALRGPSTSLFLQYEWLSIFLLAMFMELGPPGLAYSAHIQFHFFFSSKQYFLFLFQAGCAFPGSSYESIDAIGVAI